MFEKGLLAGKRILVTGGGSGLGAAMGRRFVELGAELIICGRRLELLEATAAQMRGDLGGKVSARSDATFATAPRSMPCWMRSGARRRSTCWSTMRPRPSSRRPSICRFARPTRSSAPTLHGAMYCTLGCRQALDRRTAQGRGAEHSLDLDHHRPRLHRALGDGEVGDSRDDQKPRGGMGAQGHPHRGDRARRVSDAGRVGSASPRRPRRRTGPREIRSAASANIGELADLASFLISDRAGYINGEMVVQDGGAHLRSSGAEDLLQWTDAQWEKQRAARSKGLSVRGGVRDGNASQRL